MYRIISSLFVVTLFAFCPAIILADTFSLQSPNGINTLKISVEDQLRYEIGYQGKTVLSPSKLGLKFRGEAPYGKFKVVDSRTETVNQTWDNPWGRKRTYVDHFNGLTLKLQEIEEPHRTLGLECRAYDDGVAFRYVLDEKSVKQQTYILEQDETQFNFPNDPYGWFADFGSFRTSQEREFLKNRLSTIEPGAYIGCPLVVQTSADGPYLAFSEADLRNWGGMYFDSQPVRERKTAFESGLMKKGETAKSFRVPLDGIQLLSLQCDGGTDGISFDHVDWVDLQLIDKNGKVTDLTTLKPTLMTQGYGTTLLNKSITESELSIAGEKYETGFGTHASGKIVFSLDQEYAFLQGAVGHDDAAERSGSIRAWIQTLPKLEKAQLQVRLAPRLDRKGLAETTVPGTSPWRVAIIAPKAINLGDNSIILNLAEPADSKVDWSWVEPGIAP